MIDPSLSTEHTLETQVADMAEAALLAELETWPKPGLVSHFDAGSHHDMDAGMLRASIAAIKPFYAALADAGAHGATMGQLRLIGLDAEQAMLDATHGVNTHRGAVFALGLLCAASGVACAGSASTVLGTIVRERWGTAILQDTLGRDSNGASALSRFGAGGARAEAASGFPHVFGVGLPALRLGRRLAPGDTQAGRVQAFFALLASLEDTNLLHRGGSAGLRYARCEAHRFLDEGGVGHSNWLEKAVSLHQAFIRRRLSPGGCADMLACTLFAEGWDHRHPN